MKKFKLKKSILKFLLLIFSLIFIYALFNIFGWLDENRKTKDINKEINENININVDEGIFEVDFDELSNINSDTIAYLLVNNTNIEYPVVKTTDNKFYLDHDFYKNKSEAGWVFMDYNNQFDGTDKNIVIYGHNRLDGIMFGTLNKTLDEKWCSNKDNLIVRLIDKNKTTEYKIFSVYKIKEEEYYINTSFDDNSFKTFINRINNRSIHDFGDDLSKVNQILTLSTCTIVDGYRLVVHAYKV
ncbi:MAG: class B sortase [Bacilli bacterium]|nr:class B sortase [Bacilli bacterium]